jgi:hypothetical protein
MKNAREFFLQAILYSGTFYFLMTCMASCNSVVTACEQQKTAAAETCQDEILERSLRPYSSRSLVPKLTPHPPPGAHYLHMFIRDWDSSNIHHIGHGGWLLYMELHCWFCHAFCMWQMSLMSLHFDIYQSLYFIFILKQCVKKGQAGFCALRNFTAIKLWRTENKKGLKH